MVCYHPLKAFPVGLTASGKTQYKVTGYAVDHIEITNDRIITAANGLIDKSADKIVSDFVEIPCGHCVGCRLDYSRQWADRCLLEMQQHEHNWFVTLTYDDDHVTSNTWVNTETGETGEVLTLVPADFDKFMKDFRTAYAEHQFVRYHGRSRKRGEQFPREQSSDRSSMEQSADRSSTYRYRFFAAGEYGDKTFRPHYHIIFFGLELSGDDLTFYKKSDLGFDYFFSPWIDSIWKKGRVIVANATWETCAYTARYVLKKQKGDNSRIYKEYNFVPEFTRMSRKPGIGRRFFDDHSEKIFSQDYISLPTKDGSKRIYPGSYYKRLYKQMDEEEYQDWINMRLGVSDDERRAKACLSSQRFLDQLETEEAVKQATIKGLKRSL